MATRKASAQWQGNLKEGNGKMALGSGAWEGPFTFKSRFEEGQGTNPEELIGAAEAGCFTTFQRTAQETKQVCIISRALTGVGEITVDATLES